MSGRAPLFVLAVGNPSRGDDALGPTFVERATPLLADAIARGEVELFWDFQLQVEHALDLAERARVLFVDASVSAAPPFAVERVVSERDRSFTSHALSPSAVLAAYREILGEPPEASALAIRGERFELGEGLTPAAAAHLEAALEWFVRSVTRA